MIDKEIGIVIESAHNEIGVKIHSNKIYESIKNDLQIGKYIIIQDGNHNFVLASIQSIKIVTKDEQDEDYYLLNAQPIGVLIPKQNDETNFDFQKGNIALPSPTEKVYLISKTEYSSIDRKSTRLNSSH